MPIAGSDVRIPRVERWSDRGVSRMFAFRRVLTVLLIAILASGALSAPALRHTHAMSEHAESRNSAAEHSHSHHHGDAYRHGSEAEPTFHEPAVEHLHVLWFGIGLTLPVSPDDSSDRPNTVDEWVPLLSEMLPPQVVATSDVLDLNSTAVGASAFAVTTPARAEPFVPPKISRLCDTARRERSGVLNI